MLILLQLSLIYVRFELALNICKNLFYLILNQKAYYRMYYEISKEMSYTFIKKNDENRFICRYNAGDDSNYRVIVSNHIEFLSPLILFSTARICYP